jgi:cold shock CspA family protein
MKKELIVAIAVLAIGLATPVFAGKPNKSGGISYWEYEGEVARLIPDQGALLVKDKDDGKEVHIHVDQGTLAELKVGDQVKFKMQGQQCVITNLVKK